MARAYRPIGQVKTHQVSVTFAPCGECRVRASLAEAGVESRQPGGAHMPDSHSPLGDRLENLLQVEKFLPPARFADGAQVTDPAVYEQAAAAPEAWWATQARERLHWSTP